MDTKEWLAAFVYVQAGPDEIRSDQASIPPGIRSRAIDAGQEFAMRFHGAAEEDLNA